MYIYYNNSYSNNKKIINNNVYILYINMCVYIMLYQYIYV